jgi:hypothetical protein
LIKVITSPYEQDGYGLKWPSSQIASDLYNHKHLFPRTELIGMDFGCGLGAHGLLLESIDEFSKIIYIDKDEIELKKVMELRKASSRMVKRQFCHQLEEILDQRLNVIIDRASLQHCTLEELEIILGNFFRLLSTGSLSNNLISSKGLLISEWIYSAPRESQIKRFSNITFFAEAEQLINSKFKIISKKVTSIEHIGKNTKFVIINSVLQPI